MDARRAAKVFARGKKKERRDGIQSSLDMELNLPDVAGSILFFNGLNIWGCEIGKQAEEVSSALTTLD